MEYLETVRRGEPRIRGVMHTQSCIRVRMRVMGGGGLKVNPNTEIEKEDKIKNLHKNLILVYGLTF